MVRCPKCTAITPITDDGVRVDELAANLLALLEEFGRKGINGKVCKMRKITHNSQLSSRCDLTNTCVM